jgi:hypothetical protein
MHRRISLGGRTVPAKAQTVTDIAPIFGNFLFPYERETAGEA